MELTKERLLYLENKVLQKKNRRLLSVMHDMPQLFQMVMPASVLNYDRLPDRSHPPVSAFAKQHGYSYQKLLMLLQREKVLEKTHGTWVFTPEYRHAGLVFYTIGRLNCYKRMDMYLLPEGEDFMLAFMKDHPTKRIKRKE